MGSHTPNSTAANPSLGQTRVMFQTLTRNSRTVHWRINADGLYTYISDVVEDLLGYKPEELIGKVRYYELCPEPERAALLAAAAPIVQAKSTFRDLENCALAKDGRVIWMSTSGVPLLGIHGELLGFEGWDTDITERKQAELRLQDLSERLLLAKRAAGAGIWDWDVLENRLDWDDDLLRMYGVPPGRKADNYATWRDSVHPEDRVRAEEEVRLALAGEREYHTEFRILRPDGEVRHLKGNAIVQRDATGRPIRMVGMNWDITESKRMEAQFLRAQRMESLGTLAGGVAHNLNNALAPILVAVELIQHRGADPETLDLLRTIELSARRGVGLVGQIVSFARGVEGVRSLTDPGKILADLAKIVRDTFPKQIVLEVGIPPQLPPVLADVTQIHQVLLNLCVNAADAMPAGGRLILAAAHQRLDARVAARIPEGRAGDFVVLTVRDTGTGMAPEVLERIFDPFFTTKEVGKGTGLGLSTARGVVQSHDGFWQVESRLGEGSAFSVYLPVSSGRPAAPRASEPRMFEALAGQGQRVLVVEDEAPVREIIVRALTMARYQVETAEHGQHALELIRSTPEPFHLIITDMMMPVMDGVAFLRGLRTFSQVPVIVITALDVPALPDVVDVRCLPKPFEVSALLSAATAALQQRPPA
jgi:PAS domain S-box-containing protein